MPGTETGSSGDHIANNDVQEKRGVYDCEINLIDYILVLWRH